MRLRAETLFAEPGMRAGGRGRAPTPPLGAERRARRTPGWAGGVEGARLGVGVGVGGGDAGGAGDPADPGAPVGQVLLADPVDPGRVERGNPAGRPDPGDEGSGADARVEPSWRARAGLAVRERLPLWLRLRCGLERRSVIALGLVLIVAAVFAAQHFWTGRTQPVRAPDVLGEAAGPGSGPGPSPSPGTPPAPDGGLPQGAPGDATGAGSGTGAAADVVVDVRGKVRRPGVQRLPGGSRVADALREAGGVRPGTKADGLNRARLLIDGEQIVVGGPVPPEQGSASAAPPGSGPGPAAGGTAAGPTGSAGAAAGPVGLNTATADQLDTLPGVGPVLAQHIIDYRTEHGGFRSVDELREVNGIGEKRFADLQNLVRP
ncbi:ComEA family DNA-binding protein [Streptomyces sp. LNU-CPARS28]|uniref:ComEA family DNA-binding protein n=1 Tax=Streptomyces sp. LNU-CPARS28 TaxID=3137371 RepID=UPI001F456452|nr:ComEA family DNA-binding protein [Streptomyces alboflavus]